MKYLCQHDDGKCSQCGAPMQWNLRRVCRPGQPVRVVAPRQPSLAKKLWNYGTATAKWVAAGSPVRTPEEIERIFAICEACPKFSGGEKPHCNLCGCSLSKSPNGLQSKIAMSTESCPLNPPKW